MHKFEYNLNIWNKELSLNKMCENFKNVLFESTARMQRDLWGFNAKLFDPMKRQPSVATTYPA